MTTPHVNYMKMLIVDLPREFWSEAEAFLKQLIDTRKVRKAVRVARARTQLDRKHRYVVRTTNGTPIAVTSTQINMMRRQGLLPKNINCMSVYTHALEVVRYDHGKSNRRGSGQNVVE